MKLQFPTLVIPPSYDVTAVISKEAIPSPFLIERISIPDHQARCVLVTDAKVGYNSQFYGSGALPGSLFSESSKIRLSFDVVPDERGISVSLTNKTKVEQTVDISVTGRTVKPPVRAERISALGLGSTLVQPKASAKISVQPACVFKPRHLVVPSEVADQFDVTDLQVGKNSELAVPGYPAAVPAKVFAETAEPIELKLSTLQVCTFASVWATNLSDRPACFEGALVGTVP
jgi:hypothetical protein